MPEDRSDHIISIERMSIGYNNEHALLRDINLSVRPGEMVALIGRNGTGKSTLLKSMIGLIPLLDGACYLDGRLFQTYNHTQRAQKVSFVSSQVSHLPSISVGELVALGRMPYTGWMGRFTSEDRILLDRALEEVQMGSFVKRKLDQLSDGERQRAMIARAFVQDTPLMVLDEPTAFLDIPNKYELIRLLSGFKESGKSIVYSTHDLETAMHCADKLWVIHHGQILEGAPEDLGISGVFDALFDSSGINFDENSGRFRYTSPMKGSVHLEGDQHKVLTWTRNSLERLGYQVDKGGSDHLKVSVSGSSFKWIMNRNGHITEFDDLYSLARFLIQDK